MIILILLLGLTLRLVNINQSLWLDEAITALTVKNLNLFDILVKFSPGDFHPPLFYLIEKIWTSVFGYHELALRAPSVLFGVATIYMVYLLGKKLFSPRTALLAALLTSVNPLLIYYSQEARMYSLATFLVAGSLYFLLKKRWVIFTLFLMASLYTDYLPWFMIPVYFLSTKDKKKILISLAISLIAFIPWVPTLIHQLGIGVAGGDSSWGDLLGRTNFKNLILIPLKFTTGRITIEDKYLYNLTFGGILLFIALVLSRAKTTLNWLWLLLPLFIAALISLKVPVLSYFRFLFVVPGFILLLAEGVTGKKPLATLLVCVFLGSTVAFHLFPMFHRENWRDAANFVADGVVLIPSRAQSAGLVYYKPSLEIADRDSFVPGNKLPVYLFRYVREVFDPADSLQSKLEENYYQKVAEKNYNGVVIWKYTLN